MKNRTDNCALCQCKFENRNTTTIKVRVRHFTQLSLFRPREFSIKLHTCTIKSGWSIVYIEGSQNCYNFQRNYCSSFSEDC